MSVKAEIEGSIPALGVEIFTFPFLCIKNVESLHLTSNARKM